MYKQEHEMVLGKVHSSGAEEWYCPKCGRCLLLDWQPKFRKIVIETGDEMIPHSGGKGGLGMGTVQYRPGINTALQDDPSLENEDPRLAPWAEWMDKIGFENL